MAPTKHEARVVNLKAMLYSLHLEDKDFIIQADVPPPESPQTHRGARGMAPEIIDHPEYDPPLHVRLTEDAVQKMWEQAE